MRRIYVNNNLFFPRVWDILAIFLLFFGTTVLVVLPYAVVFVVKWKSAHPEGELDIQQILSGEMMSGLLTYGYIIPMFLTVVLTIYFFKIRPRFSVRPSHWHLLPVILAGGFFLLMIEEGLMAVLPSPEDQFKLMENFIRSHPLMAFLTITVAAAILEELLFRGIILKFMLKIYSPWKAIILSAVIFGAFHMNIWQFVGATLIGLYFGYLYWRTGSLFYPILLHFLNNALSFYLVWQTDSMETELIPKENPWILPAVMFVGLMGFATVMVFLEKYFEKKAGKTFYVATANPHKLEELQAMMPPRVRLLSLKDLRHPTPLQETGSTLEENSFQKAFQLARRYGVNVIADDTGLEVDALGGRPGVYSARFAGPDASDKDNRRKLLEELEGKDNRQARFRTVITLSDGNRWYQFEGVAEGEITHTEQGEKGFGYDSIFKPQGYDKTFAQMTPEEKNRISHRAKAIRQLLDFLENEEETG